MNCCDACGRSIEPSPFPGTCWTCVYQRRWLEAERRLRLVVVGFVAFGCAAAVVAWAVAT